MYDKFELFFERANARLDSMLCYVFDFCNRETVFLISKEAMGRGTYTVPQFGEYLDAVFVGCMPGRLLD